MSIQKKRPVYDADELDVYQVKWVLGKQRGETSPLKFDELKKLIESGRLSVGVLSDEEKGLLGKPASDKPSPKVTLSNKEIHKRYRIAKEVTLQLYNGIEKQFEDIIPQEKWNKLSEEEKKQNRSNFFRLLHGTSPQFFAYDIFKGLVGGHNGG